MNLLSKKRNGNFCNHSVYTVSYTLTYSECLQKPISDGSAINLKIMIFLQFLSFSGVADK